MNALWLAVDAGLILGSAVQVPKGERGWEPAAASGHAGHQGAPPGLPLGRCAAGTRMTCRHDRAGSQKTAPHANALGTLVMVDPAEALNACAQLFRDGSVPRPERLRVRAFYDLCRSPDFRV